MAAITFEKDGERMYFQGYDNATGKPLFTTDRKQALERPDGYYIASELEQLRFYFQEQYPELEKAVATD